ncbi:MAG: hypothetical protein KDA24_19005 [Deltaproteobacteria bacterium]|nr:hypothetical protein [Deltaproteobacteria bacterium]
MRRALTLLLALFATSFLFSVVAGCPPTNSDDDDSGFSDDDDAAGSSLCTGPGCSNSTSCPADEPDAGDPCNFNGNCHYCPDGSDEAEGYTCDGTSFSYQGTFSCNP